MTGTIEKTISLAGVDDIAITAEFEADWVDNGIGSYEYWGAKGVHHDYGWEVQNVYDLALVESPRTIAREWLDGGNFPKQNRKRYLKAIRRLANQIQKAFDALDPNDEEVFDNDELIEACGDGPEANEPDCDDIDD